ncbi:MAG TPA: sulfurtransferase TusA family protein [Nitrospirota bacterium]|nr:sulfurtransferase TusA family protein [Nitrospirota bacterium]
MDSKKYVPDQTLDCRKLSCPLPVLKTKTTIAKMAIGEILEMISSDPGSVKDIEAWAKHTGQELLKTAGEDGHYRFYIRKVK